jgi:hypothetical protein
VPTLKAIVDTLVGLVAGLTYLTGESIEDEVLEPAVDVIVSGIGSRGKGVVLLRPAGTRTCCVVLRRHGTYRARRGGTW